MLTKHRQKWEHQMKERTEKEVQHVTCNTHMHKGVNQGSVLLIETNMNVNTFD